VLCAWLVTLQIADIVTTKVVLAFSGNWEMNPAMARCIAFRFMDPSPALLDALTR
jgi:hypothetical protein